jgi:hypothetical protein
MVILEVDEQADDFLALEGIGDEGAPDEDGVADCDGDRYSFR